MPFASFSTEGKALRGAVVMKKGEVAETGLGAGVLNEPVESVVWLARRMHAYGQKKEAGQAVLSGSFIRPVECPAYSDIVADFGPFGEVNCRF
jgi:2-oxo-hept-3-ene-1,7-dioate hydratase